MSALISPGAIIFSRESTCSSVVCLYSFIALACCSLGDLYGFTFCTYDVTDIGSPEISTQLITGGNLEGLLLGGLLGYLDGLDLGTNVCNELVFSDDTLLGITLGYLVGL